MSRTQIPDAVANVAHYGLRVVLLTCAAWTCTAAEPPRGDFQPNYVAVKEVVLTALNGSPVETLKSGTLVAATPARGGLLNITTAEGKTGTVPASSFSRLRGTIPVSPASKSAADSSNLFAADLYQQIRQRPGNLFYSPASISTALAMTYAGAAGTTRQEMARVLHLSPDQEVHEGYAGLLELLNCTGDRNGYQINTANRLWGADDARFADPFLQLMKQHYLAPLETLNFRQTEMARTTINAWVADQTRGRIADLIPPGALKAEDRLVLTNAIYFLGGWDSEFDKSLTKPAQFHLSATESIKTPTMHQVESFGYTEDAQTQVVSLPYRDRSVSMVIVLPRERDGLEKLEDGFTAERLNGWIRKLQARPVHLYLPRIKLQSQLMLAKTLQSMGMATAFSENADFSAMSRSESLMISQVIHQANVDVDEKGTEAAAATAVIMTPTSAQFPVKPPVPVVFRADHPFLFLIRENRTGVILFLGRLQSPDEAR